MDPTTTSRRSFLISSSAAVGGAWLALNAGVIGSLAACARDAARRAEPLTTLTPEEGAAMRAFAARIIPAGDGLPGAEEAGAVYFVDRALGSFFADMLPPVRALLAELDEEARTRDAAASGFGDLDPPVQDELIRGREETPGFFLGRLLVVAGVFSDPVHGGNRDHAGARILGIDHRPVYAPPFGHYDGDAVLAGGGGGA